MIGRVFGPCNQLTVLSEAHKTPAGNQLYFVQCSICAKDCELHEDAIFTISKSNICSGRVPCGCSKKHVWTQKQYEILLKRSCPDGMEFIEFYGLFKGSGSKVIYSCEKHGILEPKKLYSALSKVGCFHCRAESASKSLVKRDDIHITKFTSFGTFPESTTFSRSDRVVVADRYVKGTKPYWYVYCPVCDEVNESHTSNLSRGKVPCSCSVQAQKFSYIHVLKNNDKPLFLKYGITRCIYDRVSKQSRKTPLTLETLGVWEFSNSQDCKNAEKVVKNLVGKGVADKSEMPDGFTETCNLSLLEDIIKIYEEYGGMRVQW